MTTAASEAGIRQGKRQRLLRSLRDELAEHGVRDEGAIEYASPTGLRRRLGKYHLPSAIR